MLPLFAVKCKHCGHGFETRAKAKTAIHCPKCGKPVWVRKDRPTTDREALALERARGPEPETGGDLADRWEREPEWDGSILTRPGRPGDTCGGCGASPVDWEPGRTFTFCKRCQDAGQAPMHLPVDVGQYYERERRRRAALAVKPPGPDESKARKARTEFRARKAMAHQDIEALAAGPLANVESYDHVQWQVQAREFAALLRAFIPEVDKTENQSALNSVINDFNALFQGDRARALREEYDRAQERMEREYERQERAAAYEQYEDEAPEPEPEPERKVIPGTVERAALGSGTYPGAPLVDMILRLKPGKLCDRPHGAIFKPLAKFLIIGTMYAEAQWPNPPTAVIACCRDSELPAVSAQLHELGWPYYNRKDY